MTANRPVHGQPGDPQPGAGSRRGEAEAFSGQPVAAPSDLSADDLIAQVEASIERGRRSMALADALATGSRWASAFNPPDLEA